MQHGYKCPPEGSYELLSCNVNLKADPFVAAAADGIVVAHLTRALHAHPLAVLMLHNKHVLNCVAG